MEQGFYDAMDPEADDSSFSFQKNVSLYCKINSEDDLKKHVFTTLSKLIRSVSKKKSKIVTIFPEFLTGRDGLRVMEKQSFVKALIELEIGISLKQAKSFAEFLDPNNNEEISYYHLVELIKVYKQKQKAHRRQPARGGGAAAAAPPFGGGGGSGGGGGPCVGEALLRSSDPGGAAAQRVFPPWLVRRADFRRQFPRFDAAAPQDAAAAARAAFAALPDRRGRDALAAAAAWLSRAPGAWLEGPGTARGADDCSVSTSGEGHPGDVELHPDPDEAGGEGEGRAADPLVTPRVEVVGPGGGFGAEALLPPGGAAGAAGAAGGSGTPAAGAGAPRRRRDAVARAPPGEFLAPSAEARASFEAQRKPSDGGAFPPSSTLLSSLTPVNSGLIGGGGSKDNLNEEQRGHRRPAPGALLLQLSAFQYHLMGMQEKNATLARVIEKLRREWPVAAEWTRARLFNFAAAGTVVAVAAAAAQGAGAAAAAGGGGAPRVLFEQDARGDDALYVVVAGACAAQKVVEGVERNSWPEARKAAGAAGYAHRVARFALPVHLETLGPGDVLGEDCALMGHRRRQYRAVALPGAEVLRLTGAAARRLLGPAEAAAVTAAAAARYWPRETVYGLHKGREAEQRVLKELREASYGKRYSRKKREEERLRESCKAGGRGPRRPNRRQGAGGGGGSSPDSSSVGGWHRGARTVSDAGQWADDGTVGSSLSGITRANSRGRWSLGSGFPSPGPGRDSFGSFHQSSSPSSPSNCSSFFPKMEITVASPNTTKSAHKKNAPRHTHCTLPPSPVQCSPCSRRSSVKTVGGHWWRGSEGSSAGGTPSHVAAAAAAAAAARGQAAGAGAWAGAEGGVGVEGVGARQRRAAPAGDSVAGLLPVLLREGRGVLPAVDRAARRGAPACLVGSPPGTPPDITVGHHQGGGGREGCVVGGVTQAALPAGLSGFDSPASGDEG